MRVVILCQDNCLARILYGNSSLSYRPGSPAPGPEPARKAVTHKWCTAARPLKTLSNSGCQQCQVRCCHSAPRFRGPL